MELNQRYDDSKPLGDIDNGMGYTAEAVESELVDEIEDFASELGIEYHLEPDKRHTRFSPEQNRAVLYGESHGEIQEWLLEATAFQYDNDAQAKAYQDPNGSSIRLRGDDLNINDEHLMSSKTWLKQQGS